jgi:hypothetical protein
MRNEGRRRSSYLKMKKMIKGLDDPSTIQASFLRGRENFELVRVRERVRPREKRGREYL